MYHKEFLSRFVIITFSFLVIVLSLSYSFFPWKPSSLWELLMAMQNKKHEKQGFFERLFDPGRSLPPQINAHGKAAGKRTRVKKWGNVQMSNNGTPSYNMSSDQLILRENILSQLILLDRHQSTEKNAWSAVKRIKSQGDYRDYEEERFTSEVMWMNYFDDKTDKKTLHRLRSTTSKLAKTPSAYFEDFYNAGIAELLNGNASQSLQHLQLALEHWPARGRVLGNVYFGLLMAHAVEGHIPEALLLLNEFKEFYPDWLHVETYVPDIKELVDVYPKSPLLHVVNGRLAQNVHDYATAYESYSTALNSIKRQPEIHSEVANWMKEIDNERY